MDARLAACVITAFACSGSGNQAGSQLLDEGRTYTAWLYGSEYEKLWERFSPEMRQTFGSVADLAEFASRAVNQLGGERGTVAETVNEAEPYTVYSRSASFEKSSQRMLIEWSLADDGAVTGLVVRPVLEETGK